MNDKPECPLYESCSYRPNQSVVVCETHLHCACEYNPNRCEIVLDKHNLPDKLNLGIKDLGR